MNDLHLEFRLEQDTHKDYHKKHDFILSGTVRGKGSDPVMSQKGGTDSAKYKRI